MDLLKKGRETHFWISLNFQGRFSLQKITPKLNALSFGLFALSLNNSFMS